MPTLRIIDVDGEKRAQLIINGAPYWIELEGDDLEEGDHEVEVEVDDIEQGD